MHADDAAFDDGADRKALEAVRKQLPQPNIVAALAFVVKTVDAVDVVGLVVAS